MCNVKNYPINNRLHNTLNVVYFYQDKNQEARKLNCKKIIALSIILTFLSHVNVFAGVMGEETYSWETDMGAYTKYRHTDFYSDTYGNQAESYIEYIPNAEAKPVVVNGDTIWGTRNIKNAVSYLSDQGIRTIGGINADYFSFKTGIPMGNTIIGGEIVSKENVGQDAIAFKSDGEAFIDWFDVKTTLSDGKTSIGVDCINKWYQAGYDTVFLLNDKFGKSTKTESECLFVLCDTVEGELKIGTDMILKVEDKFIYNGDIAIAEDKTILFMQTDGLGECYEFLNNLEPGQKISISNNAYDNNNEKWSDVMELVSSVGGRIILNGEVQDISDGTVAPRTAVGVREDKSVILYTLDGRQAGYSKGATIKMIGERLKELGCVEALNLDGGGSTTIGAVFPGYDEFLVMNKPSDGYNRSVANFLFIRDDRERTDIPWVINMNGNFDNTNYLSGMCSDVSVKSVFDTSNYKMDDYTVDYELENFADAHGTIDNETLYLYGSGKVKLSVISEDVKNEIEFNVYETPDNIKICNEEDGKEIEAIYTEANEELQINLKACAFVESAELNSSDELFKWETEGEIGSVNSEGIFTLSDTANKEGKIKVSVGGSEKEIPVKISDYPKINPFSDTQGHWAQNLLTDMYVKSVINGIEEDGKLYFYPDKNMSRIEFCALVSKYLGINEQEYEKSVIDFSDNNLIRPWAINFVKAMVANGIINGKAADNGTVFFAPEESITRAEAMTILGRTLGEETETSEIAFLDAYKIPDWAVEGIGRLLTLNIVSGYEDNTISPNENVKRAEAVTMIYKLMNAE